MKRVKPDAVIIRREDYPSDYGFIEAIGRTCYKSEDMISEGSALKFVSNLKKRGHYSVLEHCWVHFKMPKATYKVFMHKVRYIPHVLKYLSISRLNRVCWLISGNLRAFIDLFNASDFLDEDLFIEIYLKLQGRYPEIFTRTVSKVVEDSFISLCEDRDIRYLADSSNSDISLRHITHTVKFICDRGVSHELVRHRPWAISQESTRYCNYGHDNEITVIEPFFFKDQDTAYKNWQYSCWEIACHEAEMAYLALVREGTSPQEARSVLPNSLKTEVVMTGTEEQWIHLLELRYRGTTGNPHPQMKELMSILVPKMAEESNGRINFR